MDDQGPSPPACRGYAEKEQTGCEEEQADEGGKCSEVVGTEPRQREGRWWRPAVRVAHVPGEKISLDLIQNRIVHSAESSPALLTRLTTPGSRLLLAVSKTQAFLRGSWVPQGIPEAAEVSLHDLGTPFTG